MLTTEKVFESLIKLGFKEPSEQPNIKVERLNHDDLTYSVYVKPLQEKNLKTKYILAVHPHYLLANFESLATDIRNSQLKAWKEKLSAHGIYLNENIESKTSFAGFPPNPKNSGQAITFNFTDHSAVQAFCKLVLKINASTSNEIIPYLRQDSDVSDKAVISEEEALLPSTELNTLVKVRLGQSNFRRELLKYWQGCSVSDCTFEKLLIASHIIPWSEQEDSRLNPYNGLLLSPNLDAVFDKGYISFNDDGSIMISSELSPADLSALNLSSSLKLRKLDAQHLPFLAWHRENLFKA